MKRSHLIVCFAAAVLALAVILLYLRTGTVPDDDIRPAGRTEGTDVGGKEVPQPAANDAGAVVAPAADRPEPPAEPWGMAWHDSLPAGVEDVSRPIGDEAAKQLGLRVNRNKLTFGTGESAKVLEMKEFTRLGSMRRNPSGTAVMMTGARIGGAERLLIDVKSGAVLQRLPDSSFHDPDIPISFSEYLDVFWLDDRHIVDTWVVDPPGYPNIDRQHQRVILPIFGGKPEAARFHYVFAIRNIETDGITVLSVPVPAGLMVEFQQSLQAPGWIAVNTRKDGETEPTRSWVLLSMGKPEDSP
jgi:hypothetical protein